MTPWSSRRKWFAHSLPAGSRPTCETLWRFTCLFVKRLLQAAKTRFEETPKFVATKIDCCCSWRFTSWLHLKCVFCWISVGCKLIYAMQQPSTTHPPTDSGKPGGIEMPPMIAAAAMKISILLSKTICEPAKWASNWIWDTLVGCYMMNILIVKLMYGFWSGYIYHTSFNYWGIVLCCCTFILSSILFMYFQ